MVEANNAINNTVGASISGVTNTLSVTNPSDTASSSARQTQSVGGSSAADPALNWNVLGTTDWTSGIDNSDGDKWKLSNSTSLGTTDSIEIFTTGEYVQPRNCRFTATLSATIPNVTGDSTVYTAIFDTEVVDTGNNYDNTTGLFTAPVDGVYFFSATIALEGITAAMNQTNFLFGVNGTTVIYQPSSLQSVGVHAPSFGLVGTSIFKLTAGDTVGVLIEITGGAKVADLDGSGYPGTQANLFSGILLG